MEISQNLASVAQTITCTAAMTAIEASSSFVPISLQRDVIVVHRSDTMDMELEDKDVDVEVGLEGDPAAPGEPRTPPGPLQPPASPDMDDASSKRQATRPMALVTEEETIVRDMLQEINYNYEQYVLKINANKTKTGYRTKNKEEEEEIQFMCCSCRIRRTVTRKSTKVASIRIRNTVFNSASSNGITDKAFRPTFVNELRHCRLLDVDYTGYSAVCYFSVRIICTIYTNGGNSCGIAAVISDLSEAPNLPLPSPSPLHENTARVRDELYWIAVLRSFISDTMSFAES
ncbi:hypothetical protein ANN_20794 [Periplaneta americana]|uniref:Uncharacterized protein n=1 Tax=Periplaneta americana TaxID=6978 RepID=A0ABQ8SDK6_PERAM|nr:hypothetical protein ANN_20794 [Periplaneta americana]